MELLQIHPNPVSLARLTPADAADYFRLFDENRDHISHYDKEFGQAMHSAERVAAEFSPQARTRQHFAILEHGELVGSTGLFTYGEEKAAISYWLTRDAVGRGLATRACEQLITKGIQDLNIHTFQAAIHADNIPSQSLAGRLGFERHLILDDEIIYQLET